MKNPFLKKTIVKKLKEKIDYNFYRNNPEHGRKTIKELPYSLIVNGGTKQVFISKNNNLDYGGYIKISINDINYRDIKNQINMNWGTFDSFAFNFYFNPLSEENFYEVISNLLLELTRLYNIVETPELDDSFVVPDDLGWLGGGIGEKNKDFDISVLKLKILENDMGLDEIIIEKEVRKKIGIMLLCIENKKELEKNGGKIPKGYILRGKPGLGKTSLMKSILKEVLDDIEIFSISRKDYTSKWVGEGEQNFSKILNSIQEYGNNNNKHCIIFFDEFDDIGRIRTNTHEVHAAELNVLLRFLDGLGSSDNITFIAGTNSTLEELDPAILRGGRTDDIIELKMPDKKMLEKYFKFRIGKLIEQNFFEKDIINDEMYESMMGLSFGDLNAIIIDLLNTRFIEFKYGNLYAINKEKFKQKIEDYKGNKGIGGRRIGFKY